MNCSKCKGPDGKYREILKDYTCDGCEERAFEALMVGALTTIPTDGDIPPCPECNGTGVVHWKQCSPYGQVFEPVDMHKTCPTCQGEGIDYSKLPELTPEEKALIDKIDIKKILKKGKEQPE